MIDPATSRIVCRHLDDRVDADDMFVALEETGGHLFWCTNAGCFGFSPIRSNVRDEPSADLVRLDGSSDGALRLVGDLHSIVVADYSQKKHIPICRARCHPRFVGVFALGGKEVNLEIWKSPADQHLAAFELEYVAKNVANDEYNLKQPVWISDLCFLDDECKPLSEGYMIACCTRFHQVCSSVDLSDVLQIRVYNTLVSRRPILNVDVGTSPLVSMTLGKNDRSRFIYRSRANS